MNYKKPKGFKEVPLNKFGVNANLRCKINPEVLKKFGFRQVEDHWYYCKLFNDCELSFNVTLYPNNEDYNQVKIECLDESYGQTYDYQYLIDSDGANEFVYSFYEFVEDQMQALKDANIILGHEVGDYI